jgi:hypothetical protein
MEVILGGKDFQVALVNGAAFNGLVQQRLYRGKLKQIVQSVPFVVSISSLRGAVSECACAASQHFKRSPGAAHSLAECRREMFEQR